MAAPVLAPLLALLLVGRSPGPEDPAAPTPPACPNGDAPGAMGELVLMERAMTLAVTDGVGVLTVRERLENRGPGPARFIEPVAHGVVRRAWIERPAAATIEDAFPTEAVLDDEDAARVRFSGWVEALEHGVPEAEATAGKERVGILVEGDEPPYLHVAAACSQRAVIVGWEAVIGSVPVDGAWHFEVPPAAGEGSSFLEVHSEEIARVLVDGAPAPRGPSVVLSPWAADASGEEPQGTAVVVAPLRGPRLRARGLAVRVAPELPWGAPDGVAEDPATPVTVVRAELDVPGVLAEAPAGLRVVFVLDASVSVGQAVLDKQLQLVHGILDELPPDARWALVIAGRRPRVVVPAWRERRDRAVLEDLYGVSNGSDVPAAIELARGIASDTAPEEVGRVIVFSDMRLRFSDDDARLVRSMSSSSGRSPLVHVVSLPEDANEEEPLAWTRTFADDDPRAAGPEATGGIWVESSGGDDDEDALVVHLVRPTRIDRPRVTLAGLDVLEAATGAAVSVPPQVDEERQRGSHDMPLVLREGEGFRVEAALGGDVALPRVPALAVEGFVWATSLQERAREDRDLLPLLAAGPLEDELPGDVVRALGRSAHAVTRMTSLVAVPRWRPLAEALHGWSSSCSCGGCSTMSGHGISGRSSCGGARQLREQETLARLLAEDMQACAVRAASLEVEFDDLEILDVQGVTGGSCVVERMWRRRLDLLVEGIEREPGAFWGHRRIAVGADVRPAR